MNRFLTTLSATALVAVFLFGCSLEQSPAPLQIVDDGDFQQNPASARLLDPSVKLVNTETLGDPGFALPAGSGFAIGGVGLDTQPGIIDVDVPGTVKLALLYWSGGDPEAPFIGDDTVTVDGDEITGELIGGPTPFYNTYEFLAYRADITDRVTPGANSFVVGGMDFDPLLVENNGAGVLVIYEDGPMADLQLRDGLDMAYFNFTAPLDATVPQTFTFAAADAPRTAELDIFAGSVEADRPNEITVTTSGGVQSFVDPLSSGAGRLWDAITLSVNVPADATELTVELISTPSMDPRGASMSWIACGLSVPVSFEEPGDCRVTGGGRDMFDTGEGWNDYTFGGQAGSPTGAQPQPRGEWTHTQHDGPAGSFTFHAGTSSAPSGTEIDWISCMDEGWCRQARPAPFKQIDFAGVGTFRNIRGAPDWIADHVTRQSSLHWFEVNIDDLGEPGRADRVDPPAPTCDPMGFGLNGGPELADCDCPDFYRITIYEGPTDGSPVMYEVYGYIDRGNFQIHPSH